MGAIGGERAEGGAEAAADLDAEGGGGSGEDGDGATDDPLALGGVPVVAFGLEAQVGDGGVAVEGAGEDVVSL